MQPERPSIWLHDSIQNASGKAGVFHKHGVHHTMIASWKRQAIDGMAGTFSGAGDVAKAVSESEVERLHAKIGQLVVERDFLTKAFGR